MHLIYTHTCTFSMNLQRHRNTSFQGILSHWFQISTPHWLPGWIDVTRKADGIGAILIGFPKRTLHRVFVVNPYFHPRFMGQHTINMPCYRIWIQTWHRHLHKLLADSACDICIASRSKAAKCHMEIWIKSFSHPSFGGALLATLHFDSPLALLSPEKRHGECCGLVSASVAICPSRRSAACGPEGGSAPVEVKAWRQLRPRTTWNRATMHLFLWPTFRKFRNMFCCMDL